MVRSDFAQAIAIAILLAVAITIPVATADENPGANLSFRVTNLKNSEGKLVIAIFSSKQDFLNKPVAEHSLEIDEDGNVAGVFSALPPGTYAIAAYHDKNDDGKLNTMALVPREDYGFSNNARSLFGPPSFKKASFEIGQEDMEIEFRVK